MKKLIVFDLDGTLIDSASDIRVALAYATNQVCLLPPELVSLENTRRLIGKPLDTIFRALLPHEYHPQVDECVNVYREYQLQRQVLSATLFDGLAELLTDLRLAGHKLAVATAKAQISADTVATRLGLTDYFDLIQGVDGFPSKPDPYILFEVMRKLNATPAETIMVGDTDSDVLCAKRAGVKSCAVSWGGTWSADELWQLEPDYLANNVAELRQLLTIKNEEIWQAANEKL